jgi:single-strand DNA-binding protein
MRQFEQDWLELGSRVARSLHYQHARNLRLLDADQAEEVRPDPSRPCPSKTSRTTAKEAAAMADTHVTITGNLTDDPDLRFTPNGNPVANFRLAVTARIKDGDSWRDGDTSFFRVNVWRQLAEHVAESLSKGDRAVVIGRLKSRSWETPEGDKRSVVEVEADEVAPSLRWVVAKPERAASGGKGKGGEFNDDAPF